MSNTQNVAKKKAKQKDERLALIVLVAGLFFLAVFVLGYGFGLGLFFFAVFGAFSVFMYKEGDHHGQNPLLERLRNTRR